MKAIFADAQQCFIDGNFLEVEEEAVATPLTELLIESRRLPELILHMKVDEKNFMTRMFDEAAVKKEYNRLVEERRLMKLKEKEEVLACLPHTSHHIIHYLLIRHVPPV